MTMLRLQSGIIYGPVRSRRLGRSLGINLLPPHAKLCSFDCIYCQYGRTTARTMQPEGEPLGHPFQVLAAVEQALERFPEVDYLTFSGNGEPTLHPRFPEIVAGVRRLRDERRPAVRLAILSNSSTVSDEKVHEALGLLDDPIMKLDAGDALTLARINRPLSGISLEQIVAGLAALHRPILQTLLVRGKVSNAEGEPFAAWLATVRRIAPRRVQIYSIERPVPEQDLERVPPEDLRRLADEASRRTGVRVDPFWNVAEDR